MNLTDTRRVNPRTLIEQHGGVSRLSEKLGLETGTLDHEATGGAPLAVVSTQVISNVIRLVGTLMQREAVQMPPPERFADLLALALTDTLEHGGVPREGHIRSVVRLLKG